MTTGEKLGNMGEHQEDSLIKRAIILVLLLSAVLVAGCASQKQENRPSQNSLTEEEFRSLLTVQDVQRVLVSQVELNTRFYNYKEMAESTDPQQVVAWIALTA